MSNYILEDNISFFDEINKNSKNNTIDENLCLISKTPLDNNKITLPCNHEFNFIPLYLEIMMQKKNSYLHPKSPYQFSLKCPYCRHIHNQLLPHIKINNSMSYIYGVNTPEKCSMEFHKCNYTLKSGKNKGKLCNKTAYYKNEKCYCNLHHTTLNKQNMNISLCKAILKSGKNKDKQCSCKAIENSDFCKRHNK